MIEIIRCSGIEQFLDLNKRATQYYNNNFVKCINWATVVVKDGGIIFRIGDEIKPCLTVDEISSIEQVDKDYLVGA